MPPLLLLWRLLLLLLLLLLLAVERGCWQLCELSGLQRAHRGHMHRLDTRRCHSGEAGCRGRQGGGMRRCRQHKGASIP